MLKRLCAIHDTLHRGDDSLGVDALRLIIWRVCDIWDRVRYNHPPSMI